MKLGALFFCWLGMTAGMVVSAAQPKDAEHARSLSNKHARAERKAEVPVPPPPPGASSAIQIPVTGSAVDPSGRKYTFTGVVTLTLEDPPPPPVPTITGVRASGGTALITEALGGAPLELVGAGLPTTGLLRLTVGDKTATVRQWTPTVVFFVAPGVTGPFTAPVKIWQQVNNQWALVAQGPNLTLKVGFAEVPVLPRVDRFLAADGSSPAAFTVGQPLVLSGAGFGPTPGRVLVNWLETPVSAWSETRIQTTAGEGTRPFGMQVQVLTPQGWVYARGPKVTAP